MNSFLRVPPFPGCRAPAFAPSTGSKSSLSDAELDRLTERVVELRVGGTYWGAQPRFPDPPYVLVHLRNAGARRSEIARIPAGQSIVCTHTLVAPTDPWHLVSGATRVIADADDELALIAALAQVPVRTVGDGKFKGVDGSARSGLRDVFRRFSASTVASPLDGEQLDFSAAVDLCGFWRGLIDSNRSLTAALGLALWKRRTVSPLLWGGIGHAPFSPRSRSFGPADRVAVWKSRTPERMLRRLEASGAHIIEVEDGFIRSVGLGAECVPPLSIIVDHLGIYFDPNRPSELEDILQQGSFAKEITDRAARLRELIVQAGISKYGAGAAKLERCGTKRHLMVVGQVEDDRAVLDGLGPRTNLELLRKVREANPDPRIIYRPHPDVEAGHRRGVIPDGECLKFADEMVRNGPISSWIDLVDEVHVNTSLAGFEALLRGKAVITYGVPFYAGWGLSRDFGPIPSRRNAKRSIDQLVAATLLLYPRYLDPVTGLPCPPETLIRRIGEGSASASPSPIVRLRRLQGRWKRGLAEFWRNRR